MANVRSIDRTTGTGQTIGAVTADLVTVALVASTSYALQGVVVGKDSSGNTVAGLIVSGAKRAGGGAALVGAAVQLLLVADAAVATATATWVASGNNVILRATGLALITIDWTAEATVWAN